MSPSCSSLAVPWLLCVTGVACGGQARGGAPEDAGADGSAAALDARSSDVWNADGGFATDAPETASDAGTSAEAGPACGTPWSVLLGDWPQAPWDGGYGFSRESDFLTMFRAMAIVDGFIDAAHGVDCADAGVCSYDPSQPQLSPQDVHYSNGLGEFTGPNGHPYVWTYVQGQNLWLVADQSSAPESYRLLVARNAGCLPGCACDAGG